MIEFDTRDVRLRPSWLQTPHLDTSNIPHYVPPLTLGWGCKVVAEHVNRELSVIRDGSSFSYCRSSV